MLNVDFEYFDPQPSTDFHGLKTLLRQLFDVDNQLLDLSELADLILSQPLLGTTIKCDGIESDPNAFLTILNTHEHMSKPTMKKLCNWITSRIPADNELKAVLTTALRDGAKERIGLVLGERWVNMPHETVPPMYSMLLEEIQWANEEKEPYQFTHYLVVSKVYTENSSSMDVDGEEDERPAKKKKKGGKKKEANGDGKEEVQYFHPEDEVLARHALLTCNFEYANVENGSSDSKRAFQELGIRPQGHLILIKAEKFEDAVKAVGEYLGGSAGG